MEMEVAKEAPPMTPAQRLRWAEQGLLNAIDALHPGTYGDNLRLMEAIDYLIQVRLAQSSTSHE